MGVLRTRPGRARLGHTLIELLVVVGILLVLAALATGTVLVLRGKKAESGADQLQAALLIARQRAVREQVPVGLRLIPDPANPNFVRELAYVQQPDDFVPNDTLTISGTTAVASAADFYGGFGPGHTAAEQYPVQPGDYLRVNGGLVVQVAKLLPGGATCNRLLLSRNPLPDPAAPATRDYRILRQPRRVPGVDTVKLPADVAIDLSLSVAVPSRAVAGTDTPPFREILFSPRGGVVGRGTDSDDKVVLWVRDASRDAPTEGEPALIAVQVRTGLIAAYPVDVANPGAYPGGYYSFTQEARGSGL
jgi:prepilin-type N-terminal cleavage/methylation domain-containing protein